MSRPSAAESPGLSSSAPSPGAPWLRRNKPPPPPPPPPRSHSFSEEQHDFALVAHSASSTHKQLSAAELSLLQRAKDVQRLEAQLKLLQMEHETALSDLDATHERAQQLESENGHLKAEFARRQTEFQFFIEQSAEEQQRASQLQATHALVDELQLQKQELEQRVKTLEEEQQRASQLQTNEQQRLSQLQATQALNNELLLKKQELEQRVKTLERELFEAEHLHAETQAEREEEKEEKRRQTEQALDWASTGRTCLERSLSTLKDENKRLIGLLRESEDRCLQLEESVRELDTRLFKSSEVAKLRQINLNELQAKIRAERQVWQQLQQAEQQQQQRQNQALANRLGIAQAREKEMHASLSSFLASFRDHLSHSLVQATTISTRPPAVNLPLIPQPATAYDTIIASKPQHVPASDRRRGRNTSSGVPSLARQSSSAVSNPHRVWTNAERQCHGQTDEMLVSPSPMSPSSLTSDISIDMDANLDMGRDREEEERSDDASSRGRADIETAKSKGVPRLPLDTDSDESESDHDTLRRKWSGDDDEARGISGALPRVSANGEATAPAPYLHDRLLHHLAELETFVKGIDMEGIAAGGGGDTSLGRTDLPLNFDLL